MKCKNCGGNITIKQRFCENCGSPNEQFEQHIKDMDRYQKTFSETRQEVLSNSRWFVEYIAPITSLVIAVIFVALAVVANNNLWVYDMVTKEQENYAKKHQAELDARYASLLENKEYHVLYMLNYRLDWSMLAESDEDGEAYGWRTFYSVEGYYLNFRNAIVMYYDENFSDSYSRERSINEAAENIADWQEELKSAARFDRACAESKEAIANINAEAMTFLQAYCNFTSEDCDGLSEMTETEIVSLLARRMIYAD